MTAEGTVGGFDTNNPKVMRETLPTFVNLSDPSVGNCIRTGNSDK
jgi:hypothetical protein